MKRFLFTLIFSLCLIVPAVSQSGESQAIFNKANQLYLEGNYSAAKEEYLKIVNTGHESAELFYNLGNTCYKMGLIPPAILYYEKALVIDPRDEDTRFNLGLANQLIVDKIDPVSEFFVTRWIKSIAFSLKTDAWAAASIVFFVLTLVFAVIIYSTRGTILKKTLLLCAILFMLMSVTTFFLGQKSFNSLNKTPSAIVFSPSITAKSSPDMSGTDLFVLHEGVKVKITDQVGSWIRIRLADGNEAWIPEETIVVI